MHQLCDNASFLYEYNFTFPNLYIRALMNIKILLHDGIMWNSMHQIT